MKIRKLNENLNEYFGEEESEKYGELVCSKLAGKTISKRMSLADKPGGITYEANKLGINKWTLLNVLEGLCYQGKAKEINDSTYKILDTEQTYNESWADDKREELNNKPKRDWTDDDWEAFNHIENMSAEQELYDDDLDTPYTPEYWYDDDDNDEDDSDYEDRDYDYGDDDDEDYDCDDTNLEVGFDPYTGCYTDDC